MKPRTLRRKLQKKLKHRPFRKCPVCGERLQVYLSRNASSGHGRLMTMHCWGQGQGICYYEREIFWSGGVTGRHIPAQQ